LTYCPFFACCRANFGLKMGMGCSQHNHFCRIRGCNFCQNQVQIEQDLAWVFLECRVLLDKTPIGSGAASHDCCNISRLHTYNVQIAVPKNELWRLLMCAPNVNLPCNLTCIHATSLKSACKYRDAVCMVDMFHQETT
jgi:hypothetical protein